jgi:excisionase family DNA binding protein
MIDIDRFYTVRETASLLRVSAATIHRLIVTGQLRASRVGRSLRISGSSLHAAINPSTGKVGRPHNGR